MAMDKIEINEALLIRASLKKKEDFCGFLEHFSSTLPTYAPGYWNIVEPINRTWDVDEILEKMPVSESSILWKRKSKPRGWGRVARQLTKANSETRHAYHALFVDVNSDQHAHELIEYAKQVARTYGVVYAFIDSPSDGYREAARRNKLAPFYRDMYVRTEGLNVCLYDILWGQIFGPEYVRLFGLEKLLAAPAYKVELVAEDSVYLQLTESLFDVHNDYRRVDKVRWQVKEHLDDNIFFDRYLPIGHDYRKPVFEFTE
ncbi:hypothetical protein [Achromobacter aloeverae]